jgi:hypothetical protein
MRRTVAELTLRLLDDQKILYKDLQDQAGQKTFFPGQNRRWKLTLLLRSRKVRKFEDIAEIQAEIQAGLGGYRNWSSLHAYNSARGADPGV